MLCPCSSHAGLMMMNAHIENLKSHNNIRQGLEQPGKDVQNRSTALADLMLDKTGSGIALEIASPTADL